MKRSCIAMLATLMLMPLLAEAQLTRLTVTVHGLAPATGTLEVSLFNSAETFMHKPFLQKSKPVAGKEEITVEFAGLLQGEYAVVAVHDENGNGVLDTGFLGFGGESFGYSNDATAWLGRPDFATARFTVGTDDVEIVIHLD